MDHFLGTLSSVTQVIERIHGERKKLENQTEAVAQQKVPFHPNPEGKKSK